MYPTTRKLMLKVAMAMRGPEGIEALNVPLTGPMQEGAIKTVLKPAWLRAAEVLHVRKFIDKAREYAARRAYENAKSQI